MIKEEVKHIFDRSACLTRKQVEAYLAGNMITEEVYAVEHHINGCPLCSIAMDGMQLRKDAIVVMNQTDADFLRAHLDAMPQPTSSGAAAYMKNLKPKEINKKPLMAGLKLAVAAALVVGALWFVQSIGKDKKDAQPVAEQSVNAEPEEQMVTVEEPVLTDSQAALAETAPVETTLEEAADVDAPATTQPAATVNAKPEPAPAATNAPATKPGMTPATTKGPVSTAKQTATIPGSTIKPMVTPPPPPPAKEQPKPVAQQEPEQKPVPQPVKEEPKAEPKPEPKPAAKKEEADEMPADPLKAGRMLMDKGSYNQAINRMRNEMRSNNKTRRQEAVMMVARCYQQLGNTQRAKELLSSIIDEGGPEKKAAKKALKEIDKNAKDDE
jgi:hypothetical protein